MDFRQYADTAAARRSAVRSEQAYVSKLYARLDELRERTETALRAAHGDHGTGTEQALFEREVTSEERARRLSQLRGVERGLCFGRIDHTDGQRHYIGRLGLRDEEHESILVDWRAPAARPFYAATPSAPGLLARRRHLHTRGRTVTDLDDEVFDLDTLSEHDRRTLVGEAALLASLRQGRTGRMSDVVATIQAEQDHVIRSSLQGVLVVQGGPGTGKTVAALHRAAYLLYTHHDTLSRRGVLVIGPNATFLRYIGQVLPSLGETDVVLSALNELYPGVRATGVEPASAAVVKGDARMVDFVAAAVSDRQRVPSKGLAIDLDGMTLRVDGAACHRARESARALYNFHKPHNIARKLFVTEMLTLLARDEAEQLNRPLDEEDLPHARALLWQEPAVRAELTKLWPELTPQQLLTDLFADSEALRSAGERAGLSQAEWESLARPAEAPWTVADVPLLDEAAELLGADDSAERARHRAAERERAAEERYAQGVLEVTGLSEEGALDAAALAERHRAPGPQRTTAERAEADRGWAYGHVIVDEAQELSGMAWRMVTRRVPTRSMTVVGDIAQTSAAAGARSWAQMLDTHVKGRWREQRLLINYRTPAEIMAVAADVLASVAPDEEPPESVRSGGALRAVRVSGDGSGEEAGEGTVAGLATALPALAAEECALIGEGRVAVLTPDARHGEVAALLPDAAAAATPEALDTPVAVLTVTQAKGLEFDAVLLIDPAGILTQSPKGGHDLYVAITRSTRRLTVVHEGDLPRELSRLTG
ncbi:HelD family protein [Salinactinospora qingdaonensis]|uniref:AAA family ATPase n=1 Tax=Salinactinospora qingdaonensis TaxID=702744 RepID=A0ABP7FK63_9ACTN